MSFYNDFQKYENRVALIDEKENKITYKDLDKFCINQRDKVEKRTLSFCFCDNSIGAVCGYIGFLQNGVVPVLFDRHMDRILRNDLISVYKPEYLYIPEEMYSDFFETEIVYKKYGFCLCKTGYYGGKKLHEQLALLLTTSGSTGSPKLVRQSYENIQANAEQIAEYLNISETDRPITTLPMNYTYGLSIINSHILKGATILLTTSTLMQREFWTFFKKQEATTFGGVPYTYEILKKLRFFGMDLPSLKYMTQAGGKLSPELHREFAEYALNNGKEFVVMYGQCEATARMAYLPGDKSLAKYGSMGVAIPNGRLELVDVNGKIISEPNVVGELVYYGPNVTLGYAENREDLAKGDERNGRLVTGDMAKFDEDGYFYIVGRKKRFLKIFGNRINLDETERMIKTSFQDCECACTGVDDRMSVYITVDSEQLKQDIRHFLAEKTGLNIIAFQVAYISEIPKNEAGKVLYSKLDVK